ncbi:hypothetical protein A3H65_03490 [Candidatus Giovannonibacteria bacterium RIFCSPLOWO2_02_FULL_45_14]|uniref:Uncharacterized protein n=1 Tax=Candidatus Giovannonibacteria bacterium RIFCSPLOWO2_12_FULL_44_15 TaxID=1798364 RepID=A0A1F5Y0G3_9BACT|nr:MAG: hypothetical protein A3C75_01795 [Candidatus Giovannonibacteria bacterium RIFCSPHIGHO2_02_FULL_44_31]OGF77151.1 MAG: hypothetical protein A3E62_00195 [Candidatus Giovannonibacteria bacterium RIFCSPHIGHO2_12_FULL_44_29]OGF90698.1 MAG: hypothetical protein A3H65_03490 [Candidatus Giovannonibacteria bacterium RIFCSPLOWO2_02_FULL_45_14]OGF93556.1 MAG: hypothetical protein A3G54_01275 [Candidatus Giovannonibacteria bacterium RIFCSPLOWO2_12_FULL_44_15]
MGIFEKLEQIREKPREVRKKLLIMWMTISMTVVIILWIGILKFGRSEDNNSASGPSPLEVLKNGFNNLTN